jgi:hypothetical protein
MNHHGITNAGAVCACALCLTAALAHEQFSSEPIDLTSPQAQYTAGTITNEPAYLYAPAPPHAPIDPRGARRELRRS